MTHKNTTDDAQATPQEEIFTIPSLLLSIAWNVLPPMTVCVKSAL